MIIAKFPWRITWTTKLGRHEDRFIKKAHALREAKRLKTMKDRRGRRVNLNVRVSRLRR